MSDKIRKNYIYCVGIAVFWLLVLIMNRPFAEVNTCKEMEVFNVKEKSGVMGEFAGDYELQQKFSAKENNLQAISFFMSNYNRINSSSFEIEIIDDNENVVANQVINCKDVGDNNFFKIRFDKQPESKGRDYVVKIVNIDGTKGNSITFWESKTDEENSYGMVKNRVQKETSLVYHTFYEKSYLLLQAVMWMLLVALSFVFVINMGKADEKQFVRLCVILGGLLIFFNPFVHMIDESTHFFRSYCISQGDFHDSIHNGFIGEYVSSNYGKILDSKLNVVTLAANPEIWFQKFNSEQEFFTMPYMSSVVPINHAVAAIGILVGRLLHLDALWIILLGRIVTYVFYVCVCYFAIKNVKHYKTVFFIIATLPMSLWLAASYSADPILLACTLMFMSICFKYRFDSSEEENQQISNRDIIILILCACSIASVKYCLYVPLLLFFFMIPKKCFNSKRQYKIGLALLGIVVVIIAFWQLYLLKAFPFTEDRNGNVNVGEQIKFVFGNLAFSIQNFADYMVNTLLKHMQSFGYQAAIPEITQMLGIVTVGGAFLIKDKYEIKDRKTKKWCMIGLAAVICVVYGLIVAALYAGFTPIGKYGVEGLQTRYWLPLLLPAMVLISYIPVKNEINNYEKKISFIMGIGLLNILAGILLEIF